jgi:putative restriction endonuclease
MTKAVLVTKANPVYDDLPELRYHFPRTYLRQVQAALNDWVVYYEPRRTSGDVNSRGGRQAYFVTARIRRIEQDVKLPDHFYAFVSDYLEFDRPVLFRADDRYFESALRKDDGNTNKGAFGRAVRAIPDEEYELILAAGFADIIGAPRDVVPSTVKRGSFAEEPTEFERPIVESIVSRPFRDAAFATAVKNVYDNTCAITGLRIINGGGRAKVQAAHIRPVAASGPDSVRNGLALCGTVHWMFDRGLR